jgi:hypothetical protein
MVVQVAQAVALVVEQHLVMVALQVHQDKVLQVVMV